MTTEIELSPKLAANALARYAALKAAAYITADGDVLDAKEYDLELARLRDLIMHYVETTGEDLHVEGIGTARIQTRRSVSYDVPAIHNTEPDLFAALLEFDALKVDSVKAKAHAERLSGLKRWEIGGGTPSLVIDKERT